MECDKNDGMDCEKNDGMEYEKENGMQYEKNGMFGCCFAQSLQFCFSHFLSSI